MNLRLIIAPPSAGKTTFIKDYRTLPLIDFERLPSGETFWSSRVHGLSRELKRQFVLRHADEIIQQVGDRVLLSSVVELFEIAARFVVVLPPFEEYQRRMAKRIAFGTAYKPERLNDYYTGYARFASEVKCPLYTTFFEAYQYVTGLYNLPIP